MKDTPDRQPGVQSGIILRTAVVSCAFAMFASWSTLAFRGATLLDTSEAALNLIQNAKISFMVVLCLSALVVASLDHCVGTRKRRYGMLACATILISGGMACCAIDPAMTQNPFPFVSFGLALSGLGSALMTPFLGKVFSDIGPKATTIAVLSGYILSTLVSEFIWGTSAGTRYMLTLLVPVAQSGFLALYGMMLEKHPAQMKPEKPHHDKAAEVLPPLPGGLLVVVALSGFLGSFVRGAMYYAGADYTVIASESLVIRLAVFAVLIAVLIIFGKGYDTFSIFWPWAAVPMLVCCVALPFLGESDPVVISTFFTIAHHLCNAFNFTIFVDLAIRYNRNPVMLFCWGRSFDALGCVIGFTLGSVLAGTMSISAHLWYVLSMISSFAIIALIVLVVINRHVTDFERMPETDDSNEDELADTQNEYAEIAARYGLTDRETDVLEQLDQGRSIPYIAQELLVSTSTVKTHVQSIYRKLDVHTRQEFLDVVRGR